MAVETITIDNLVIPVYFHLSNVWASSISGVDTNLVSPIKWALHCALRELVERTEHAGFRVAGSVTTANGTATYDLPDDFHREIEEGVKFAASDYRTLKYISPQEWDAAMLDANTTRADPYLYTLIGRNTSTAAARIKFYPTPSSTRTVTVNYLAFPTKIYDLANGTAIDKRVPPEYHHILPSGAMRHMPRYISDADWQKHAALWERYVDEAQKKSTQVVGQSYQREMYQSGWGTIPLGRVPETLTGPSL